MGILKAPAPMLASCITFAAAPVATFRSRSAKTWPCSPLAYSTASGMSSTLSATLALSAAFSSVSLAAGPFFVARSPNLVAARLGLLCMLPNARGGSGGECTRSRLACSPRARESAVYLRWWPQPVGRAVRGRPPRASAGASCRAWRPSSVRGGVREETAIAWRSCAN